MPKTAMCLKVPKKQGEIAIAAATKLGIMDKVLAVLHDADCLLIPLTRKPQASELETIRKQIPQMQFSTAPFREKQPPTQTLVQIFDDKLPPNLLASLPQAFDIVGDIIIIDIRPELKPHQDLIGEEILKIHKNIKTVLAKAGDISGVYRIREYTLLCGENKTRTIHREFGCQYHVDVAKAYFSPRLSHEHERVASQVQAGETVVDLFAGIGPFSVLIGKRQSEAKVYAVDLNPDAVELLKLNVRVNRVENRVFPICADAREITQTQLKGSADRVIMNLPETAIDFIDAACNAVKPNGGIVHFYGFVRSPDSIENLKQRFSELVMKNGRKVEVFLYSKSIRETAPFESQVVLDAKIV
ncbi:MAG TPA: class I SAM-dependent methyltransferase family protein [Candidatus Deferrimicrobiaceae bacterium]|nr:class I SAM-dependent methyltransferase family protein [Candidatus Deferrimicrobiaceae bacterium]